MFDVQLDQSEVLLTSSFYCGHCAARMKERGSNLIECPVCNSIYNIDAL